MNALPLTSVPAAPEALPGAPVEEPPALAVAGARVPRLRVLIAGDTYPPDVNGAAHFTHRLATGLAARGGQVQVVCASPEGPARTETGDGVVVHRMRSAPLLVHPTMRVSLPAGLGRALAGLIARVRPQVVHVQGHFVVGRAAVRAARAAGLPVVATNHFMPDNLFQFGRVPARLRGRAGDLAWRDLTRVFARADHVTTPTRIAAGLLRDKGLAGDVEAVSCGIDLERFRPQPRPWAREWALRRFGLPDRPTVLFVGRLDEEKRLEDLVLALPHVLNHVDVQAVIAGTGGRRAGLERLAARVGVGDRVRFLGFVPDDELPRVYAAADVFAMPGVAELQSIATLEAMASGLPVVAADAMALPHLVAGNGRLYRPGDVQAMARHLTAVLTSDRLRAEMSTVSLAMAAEHDHRHSLARFEEIYRELAAEQ
ncbi:glycosyltransferase [Microbispora sp. ATCC PTA-5024]|uniref:glycosyltransferase n=1 Tax=Microbispora sp. ATCC PTA-5024 TaxID=316330 RepID=UPI0003DC263D|nr:glycosyltransferase [Microbispora sp. ATCC PTA-5024]ETK33985.1 glucosyl transferase [Microbispora sp. ATCC PTA-5024]